MKAAKPLAALVLVGLVCGQARGHDIWIQPSSSVVETGEWLRLNLMLGNHGNSHRDFKLASKVSATAKALQVYRPDGGVDDLTPTLADLGLDEKEGYWSARYVPAAAGLYMAASFFDQVMHYAPVRDVKSAKTFFRVGPTVAMGFERSLGHALEIIPSSNPILAAADTLAVRVLYKGKPLPDTKVSFIPMGATLKEDDDPDHETKTDMSGSAKMKLAQGDVYLVVTHYKDREAKGEGYEGINYSATLCLVVPNRSR